MTSRPPSSRLFRTVCHDFGHENRAIVVGLDRHAGGKRRLDFLHACFDPGHDLLCIFTGEHLHHADHRLALAHGRGRADAEAEPSLTSATSAM